MRFHFEKVGPIDSADLELGDLTLVAGRNNTGKTYIVYTLYGFLRNWRLYTEFDREISQKPPWPELRQQFQKLLQGQEGSRISIPLQKLERIRERSLAVAGQLFSKSEIARIFSSPPGKFSDASFSITQSTPLSLSRPQILKFGGTHEVAISYGEPMVEIERRSNAIGANRKAKDLNEPLLAIASPDMPHPFILSAERFGISLFYKELDFTKNRLVEMLQQLDDEKERHRRMPFIFVDKIASRYATPVKDNIDYTRNIPDLRGRVELNSKKLDQEITGLMEGYYTAGDHDIRFKSRARKGRTFDIPLHLASSSARGLSDLYFYLRHKATKDHLLIIDEPESHLDTANQVSFARILARFVNVGVKILLTTHSDYLIKEINNLIMLRQLGDDNAGVLKRRLGYAADEGLLMESVRAYVAEKNSLTQCDVDRYGIKIPMFDKTIDDINHISNELSAAVFEAE